MFGFIPVGRGATRTENVYPCKDGALEPYPHWHKIFEPLLLLAQKFIPFLTKSPTNLVEGKKFDIPLLHFYYFFPGPPLPNFIKLRWTPLLTFFMVLKLFAIYKYCVNPPYPLPF